MNVALFHFHIALAIAAAFSSLSLIKSTKSQTQVHFVRACHHLAHVLNSHQKSFASGNISQRALQNTDNKKDVYEYGSVSYALNLASSDCQTAS